MAKYLIETTHTKEECLEALDAMKDHDPQLLDKTWLGCEVDDHTGWTTVEAADEMEAKKMIPDAIKHKAKITKVGKYTPEQVESFHQAM